MVYSNLDRLEKDEEQEEAEQEHSEENKGEMTATAATAALRSTTKALKQEAREQQPARKHEERDDLHLFLMSLDPAMRSLTLDRQTWLIVKMQ